MTDELYNDKGKLIADAITVPDDNQAFKPFVIAPLRPVAARPRFIPEPSSVPPPDPYRYYILGEDS